MDSIPHFDEVDNMVKVVDDEVDVSQAKPHGKRPSVEASTNSIALKKPRNIGHLDLIYQKLPNAKSSKTSQSQFEEAQKKLREAAVEKFARWMYDAGISFNAVQYDSFKPMIEAIGQYGPGMKPPSFHEVRVPYLKKEIEHTKLIMKEHEEQNVKYGCTLMSDGWRDKKGRSLINFLVNTPKGSMFVKSVDVSEYSHTGMKMLELLDKFVQEVGENHVVQVVTDSASNNVYAGKLLEEKYKHIFWSPCAAHCLDLMFEDIFEMPDLKRTLERAIMVNGYIYNRTQVLNMMREFTEKRDMIRPTKTRFATAFLTLRSFQMQKQNLKSMFSSEKWNKSKIANEKQGKLVSNVIFMTSFWNTVSYALKVGAPLVHVLRLVDGEKKPPMGYI
ncbi:uncharacterized protein LOC131018794 [Salvia miltiorrhiza]|uniref:uncharacterized protein LOC131018794 n=1 Tax=Salvia miltiorrhiza TaxID=226208 RepID=UPI0025AB8425|nr:uncharacterized protein LOC131018794 [Salvia miltiorrhiza]